MKKSLIQLAVLGVVSISTQAFATGFVNLPAGGYDTSTPQTTTSPVTAYARCNTTGNFGSSTTVAPTTSANNTCAVFPSAETEAPLNNFGVGSTTTTPGTQDYSAVRPVVMNNTYTGGVNKTVGNVTEYVWRSRAVSTECIYGAKFVATNTDFNPSASGNQYFEMNDFARSGFTGLAVDIAYFRFAATAEVLFRAGRTFTAVQHRALKYDTAANKALVGTNYVELPLFSGGSTASINGENTPIAATTAASTIAANQTAALNSDWVDFTTDAVFADDDGSTKAASSMFYVKSTCPATGSPPAVSNAIRLRQTAQENAQFIEIPVTGFAPTSATSLPAPTSPF